MDKRKRTPNFTQEEKLRFVRLLQDMGQCIISKVTAHDTTSNKEKELAWNKITQIHNSGGNLIRTTETLKKLWGKMKSEAKTFKAASRQSVCGTGGGPSKKFEDPVLELVAEITGRATTGILHINDCDAVFISDEAMVENDGQRGASPSPSIEYLDNDILNEDDNNIIQENLDEEIPGKVQNATLDTVTQNDAKKAKVKWANRRRPELDVPNERYKKILTERKISNRYAAERLKAEQEKNILIRQQINQNAELHDIKMKNEKLKEEILNIILKKVSGK